MLRANDLFELELGEVIGAVAQSDDEYSAGSLPRLLCFPGVAVTLCCGVVGKTAPTRICSFLDVVARGVRITSNLA